MSPLPAPGSTVPGRGAWTTTGHTTGDRYYRWLWYWPNDGSSPEKNYSTRAIHLAIRGMQGALGLMGIGPVAVTGKYDKQTADAVKRFQAKQSLKVDGVVGPTTATSLYRHIIICLSNHHHVLPQIIYGFASLESGFDPAAVGVKNGMDSGLTQINLSPAAHGGSVTPEQAFDPVFNIDWTCRRFALGMEKYDGKGLPLQLDCAIAQHNIPLAADFWYRDESPPTQTVVGGNGAGTSGGIYVGGWPTIDDYVRLVKARGATF